jgi:ribonuclease Z
LIAIFAWAGLAQDADVVVHEATNTFLPGVDKDGNMRLVTKDAKIHGHSTPAMVSACILLPPP